VPTESCTLGLSLPELVMLSRKGRDNFCQQLLVHISYQVYSLSGCRRCEGVLLSLIQGHKIFNVPLIVEAFEKSASGFHDSPLDPLTIFLSQLLLLLLIIASRHEGFKTVPYQPVDPGPIRGRTGRLHFIIVDITDGLMHL
jgi:hypothetical protein